MAKETKKLVATNCRVYGDWYERFMMGVHSRMGDQNEPDTAVSIDVLHEMLKRLEVRVVLSTNQQEITFSIELGFSGGWFLWWTERRRSGKVRSTGHD